MKFKIGDIVRIVKFSTRFRPAKPIRNNIGKVCEVTGVFSYGYYDYRVRWMQNKNWERLMYADEIEKVKGQLLFSFMYCDV